MALTQFVFCAVNADIPAIFAGGATAENKTPSGTSGATTAAANASQPFCRVATDTAVYVSFGSAPNATTDTVRFFVPANGIDTFRVSSGDKAAVVTI